MTAAKPTAADWQKLQKPFAANQVGKLPKPYRRDADKGNCNVCGGYHGLPAAHLDFVGHAVLTQRLLDVDPEWSWEPVATDEHGLPLFDRNGGLWIRLTVLGVSRLGYGDADGKQGANAVKEAIGDGLRNAGMRFGIALDLWAKQDLHEAENERDQSNAEPPAGHVERSRTPDAADPFVTPASTDEVWAEGLTKRVLEVTDLGVLRGLHGEIGPQVKAGKCTQADGEELALLIKQRAVALTGDQVAA